MNTLPIVIPAQACDFKPTHDLVRLLRGQYLLPQASPPLWRQRHEASLARAIAAMSAYPSAEALSHESAALFHDAVVRCPEPDAHVLQRTRPSRSSIALPRVAYGAETTRSLEEPAGVRQRSSESQARPGRQVWLRRHTRPVIADDELTVVQGIHVTTPVVTMIDCLVDLAARDALVVGDSLLRGIVRPDRFAVPQSQSRWEEAVAQAQRRLADLKNRRGVRRARRLLKLLTPWSESPGESELRFDLLVAGFPIPDCQYPVCCDEGVYFLDLALPKLKVGIEFDGRVKYGDQDAVYQEKIRQDRLREAGWELVRIRSEHLRYPRDVVTRVCAGMRGRAPVLKPRLWLGALEPALW